jgi:hypothetical protein
MTLVPRDQVESPRPTIWQKNAETFASTAESYVDQERHSAVREAVGLLVDRKPGLALFKLVRSVERQARISGVGLAEIPACPCGRGCKGTH